MIVETVHNRVNDFATKTSPVNGRRHYNGYLIVFSFFFAIVSVSLNRRVSISIYGLGRGVLCMAEKLETDHYTFLGNCPPTPPLSQHFALSEK